MPQRNFIEASFFDRPTCEVAIDLLGRNLRRRVGNRWLTVRIIETEAYEIDDKASHASLGRSPSREPLFMPPGTLYLYHSRGGASLNVSCRGEGNAVLIKSAYPIVDARCSTGAIATMQRLNPARSGERRTIEKLCAGQALLCRSLDLRITEWTGQRFDPSRFYLEGGSTPPGRILRVRRLGIREGRDEDRLWRFIDHDFVRHCTQNPLTRRSWREGEHWRWLDEDRSTAW